MSKLSAADADAEVEDTSSTDSEHTHKHAYGPYTIGEFLNIITGNSAEAAERTMPKLPNVVTVEYMLYRALLPYLSQMNVERGYFGTRYTLPLLNGQTAQITIDVKDEKTSGI